MNLREPLTPREYQVTALVADGLTNAEIGERLGMQVGTVRTHIEKARLKTFARNRIGLAVAYLRGDVAIREAA